MGIILAAYFKVAVAIKEANAYKALQTVSGTQPEESLTWIDCLLRLPEEEAGTERLSNLSNISPLREGARIETQLVQSYGVCSQQLVTVCVCVYGDNQQPASKLLL